MYQYTPLYKNKQKWRQNKPMETIANTIISNRSKSWKEEIENIILQRLAQKPDHLQHQPEIFPEKGLLFQGPKLDI